MLRGHFIRNINWKRLIRSMALQKDWKRINERLLDKATSMFFENIYAPIKQVID